MQLPEQKLMLLLSQETDKSIFRIDNFYPAEPQLCKQTGIPIHMTGCQHTIELLLLDLNFLVRKAIGAFKIPVQ